VRIQIAVALIAFLLLRIAHALQNSVQSLLTFTRLVAQNLMHRRSLDRLLEPPPSHRGSTAVEPQSMQN